MSIQLLPHLFQLLSTSLNTVDALLNNETWVLKLGVVFSEHLTLYKDYPEEKVRLNGTLCSKQALFFRAGAGGGWGEVCST